MYEDIRVRIAPSPTGNFHIGTARTALFNYLFAKKHNGKFILRIEDTDRERSADIYTEDILKSLKWLGLDWAEGPEKGGDYGPYFQQEREHIYEDYIDKLIDERKAYKCFCTSEELEIERDHAKQKGEAYIYSGKCRHLTSEEIDQNERRDMPFTVRLSVEPQTIVYEDLIHGKMSFEAEMIGDFIIVRSDKTPVFLLTNAIDDALMKITHILRGDDHVANTPKQLLILEALGMEKPAYGHFPLILNPNRSKMSKRKDPTSVTEDFMDKGYLPEAMVNFMALLGWSSGTDREIFSMSELTTAFDFDRIGKSPSIFDLEKLKWMNGLYIRQLSVEDLSKRAEPFIKTAQVKKAFEDDKQYFYKALELIKERMKRLDEIDELIEFFFVEPKCDEAMLVAKKSTPEHAQIAIEATLETVKGLDKLTATDVEPILRQLASENKLKDGELLWTVRVALTGNEASPGAFEMLEALGIDKVKERLAKALAVLKR